MKNKKQIYKFAVVPVLTTASIIAPIATVISCGDSAPRVLPQGGEAAQGSQAKKDIIMKNDIQLTEYDLERNILNTTEYGILPLSRIQHSLEIKNSDDNIIPLSEKIVNVGGNDWAQMRNVDDNDTQLQEHAKIFIDETVNGKDGKAQSLTNPFAEIKVRKSEILANGYSDIAKQVKDILDANQGIKFSILTKSTIIDKADADGKYTNGEYVVRIYKKKANSADLDKAIAMFKDTNKFGSDLFALKSLGGFTLTYVNQMRNPSWNGSIYSNYFQADGASENWTENWENKNQSQAVLDLFKKGSLDPVFDVSDLKDPKSIGPDGFTATEGKSGSSSFQFGSVKSNITADDIDFLNTKITQVGNLVLDRKTNQVNLELTVTNADIVSNTNWTTFESSYPYYPDASKMAIENYEKGSVESIWIPLPLHTSWAKGTDTRDKATQLQSLKKNIENISPSTLYPSLLKLLIEGNKLANNLGVDDFFTLYQVFGPHLKGVVVDLMERLNYAGRFSELLKDDTFLQQFVEWSEQTNNAFDVTTLNKVIEENPNGIPSDMTSIEDLNSSHFYSLIAQTSMFYRQLDMFISSAEGSSFVNQLSNENLITKINEKLAIDYTTDLAAIKQSLAGKSFDVNQKSSINDLQEKSFNAATTAIKLWDHKTDNLSLEVTKVDAGATADTATVEITISPAKSSTSKAEKISVTLTNLKPLSDTDKIKSKLKQLLQTPVVGLNATYKFDGMGIVTLDSSLKSSDSQMFPDIVNDLELSALLQFGMIDSLNAPDSFMNGYENGVIEYVLKVQNVDLANGKFDLLIGLHDTTNNITEYGTQVISISK